MNQINFQKLCHNGFIAGLGIAIAPVAVTATIACSRIILVNIIADIAIRILTANTHSASVYGVSFVRVPFLWKASFILAIVGGSLTALSFTAALVFKLYERQRNRV